MTAPPPLRALAPEDGVRFEAIIDLESPDDAGIDAFPLELADLLTVVFERVAPGGEGDPPFASAPALAGRLARGWTEVWFPPGDRPAGVAPLLPHPWLRVEPGVVPTAVTGPDGAAAQAQVWPQAAAGAHRDPRWLRSTPPLCGLRLRPDRARGGRTLLQIQLHADFGPLGEGATGERACEHWSAIAGWLADLVALFAPRRWSLEPGTCPLDAATVAAMASDPAQTGARALARVSASHRGATLSADALRLRRLLDRAGRACGAAAPVELAEAYALLERRAG